MDREAIHAALVARFGDAIEPSSAALAGDPFVTVDPARFRDVMTWLRDDPEMAMDMLLLITGVDRGQWIESVVHLSSSRHCHAATVKVKLDAAAPEADSIMDLWAAAEWHERECYDMVGIRYRGHANLRRILLPEDWEGHPLRKDYRAPEKYNGVTNA